MLILQIFITIKYLLYTFILFSYIANGQCLSDIKIVFENENVIVLNNGKEYKISEQKTFNLVQDPTIKKTNKVDNIVLKFNRLILIKGNGELTKILEWKKDTFTYYERRELLNTNLGKNITTHHSNDY